MLSVTLFPIRENTSPAEMQPKRERFRRTAETKREIPTTLRETGEPISFETTVHRVFEVEDILGAHSEKQGDTCIYFTH